MIFMTFISMHSVIMCVVLPWRTYEMHSDLSLKSGCDIWSSAEYLNYKAVPRICRNTPRSYFGYKINIKLPRNLVNS
jgi:hypothetical protein